MAEPLTKEELALARGYAESVYADTSDPQKHAAAVMMLRLLDTLATLEAENARLRPLAEVGEAVEGMPAGYALHHYDDASWLVRESNLSGWEKLPFPPTVTGAMKKAAEEYSYDPTWAAALRAAKGDAQTKPAP